MTFKQFYDLLVEYGELKRKLSEAFLGAYPQEVPHDRQEMVIFLADRRAKLEARIKEIEETWIV